MDWDLNEQKKEREGFGISFPGLDHVSRIISVIQDCFGILKLYSDGSIFQSTYVKHRSTIQEIDEVIWKDTLFDKHHHLHLRLYKPKNSSSDDHKLSIICYFHAGGFCFGSRTHPGSHNSCQLLCSSLQACVVSPDFRLAPEHRLPAAIEDCHSALKWIQGQALSSENGDPWLCDDGVDFERVFIFGDSSGGNIAHHLAVQLGPGSPVLSPIKIRGYILLAPFFGGRVRTKSEEERPCEAFWSLEIYDRFWRLSVPNGADADHPLVNLFGPSSQSLEGVNLGPILVLVGGDEIMRDRVKDYAMSLKEMNKKVEYVEFEGKQHGFFTSNVFSQEANVLIQVVQDFLSRTRDDQEQIL